MKRGFFGRQVLSLMSKSGWGFGFRVQGLGCHILITRVGGVVYYTYPRDCKRTLMLGFSQLSTVPKTGGHK